MENIEKQITPLEYKIINVEELGDNLFVQTYSKAFLIDENKKVYDISQYKYVNEVFYMGENLMGVLGAKHKLHLVNLNTKEVYTSIREDSFTRIFKIDNDYVRLVGSNIDEVFNIHTKKRVKPQVDCEVKFRFKIGDNLFWYSYDDYYKGIHKNFIINQHGEVVYNCESFYPCIKDDKLILSNLQAQKVLIIHEFNSPSKRVEVIEKNDFIHSNPLVHNDIHGNADSICYISRSSFVISDFDGNILKRYPLEIEYDNIQIQLWKNIAVIIVKKEENSYNIALNLDNGVQIKHKGIWILPFDKEGKQVIRGCDKGSNGLYQLTLYDLDGNEYTHHVAADCFTIDSKKMNKYLFTNVDGTEEDIVYNIDTKKEVIIPWRKVNFKVDKDLNYMDIGYGVRYGTAWEDQKIDLFDEDFNILFDSIDAFLYHIVGEDFYYEVKNNLVFLSISQSEGLITRFRKIVLDKDHHVLFDSYIGCISFIGDYLQIIDPTVNETYYIDSRTCKKVENVQLSMRDYDIPKSIIVEGKTIKLIKENKAEF